MLSGQVADGLMTIVAGEMVLETNIHSEVKFWIL